MTAEMPPVGTSERCSFCRELVTLRRAETGWHFWTAAGDPVDGRRRCLGGQPPRWDGNLMTYHVPFPKDDVRRAVRYDPDGLPVPA